MHQLIGADIYTAFAFVAIPSGVFAKGSLYFSAIPYGALTFGIALVIMPRLWVSGILMIEYTNHFGALTSSLFNIPILVHCTLLSLP